MILNRIFLTILFFFSSILLAKESVPLTKRQICDLEMIMNRGFSPLIGFMNEKEYNGVVENMRLPNGNIWPIPIILDISKIRAKSIHIGDELELRDEEHTILAILYVSSIWCPDKVKEAEYVYGTSTIDHPGVAFLLNQTKDYYVGGNIKKIGLPKHYDFENIRHSPKEIKKYFKDCGIKKVVAFQTRNPMHRAHQELTIRAIEKIGGHLLLQPVVGMTKPNDVDHFTRVKCYQALLPYYPKGSCTLNLLPISMRMAGPREALWHAIIRKNYGATHFIVGRDHAGPGMDQMGKLFYEPYAAQELVLQYAKEIGIEMVPFKMVVYVENKDRYYPINEIEKEDIVANISGTELRNILQKGQEIPAWFSYPSIIEILKKAYPSKIQRGFTIFFTGLSGSGKSTIANALVARLLEKQDRRVTILDGDIIRQDLSKGLGFSKEDRSANIRRVGFVAKEISKHGGIAVCACVAPYEEDRFYNRKSIGDDYIEIFVNTPLHMCEERDTKGLYVLAQAGKITNFTGITDRFEVPSRADIVIDTMTFSVMDSVNHIVNYLIGKGYIK